MSEATVRKEVKNLHKIPASKKVIFFHDDLDGIFSASLLMTIYGSATLIPVSSSDRWRFADIVKKARKTYDHISIVDYSFNKFADIWYDHHLVNKNQYQQIASNSDAEWYYDSKSKSAFGLMVKSIYNYDAPKHIKDLAKIIDMYDAAEFPNPRYVFDTIDPVNMVYSAISANEGRKNTKHAICRHLVTIISSWMFDGSNMQSLKESLSVAAISPGVVLSELSKAEKASNAISIFGQMTLLVGGHGEFPRYSEMLAIDRSDLHSSIKYCLRLERIPWQKDLMRVSVGKNMFHKNDDGRKINLGKMLLNSDLCKGGGHYDVGSGTIKESDMDDFIEIAILQLSGQLNKEIDMSIEKLAVDKEDDFEKGAKELSKEASMGMDEARKQLQEKAATEETEAK